MAISLLLQYWPESFGLFGHVSTSVWAPVCPG